MATNLDQIIDGRPNANTANRRLVHCTSHQLLSILTVEARIPLLYLAATITPNPLHPHPTQYKTINEQKNMQNNQLETQSTEHLT